MTVVYEQCHSPLINGNADVGANLRMQKPVGDFTWVV